jgi:hypothetical protein
MLQEAAGKTRHRKIKKIGDGYGSNGSELHRKLTNARRLVPYRSVQESNWVIQR